MIYYLDGINYGIRYNSSIIYLDGIIWNIKYNIQMTYCVDAMHWILDKIFIWYNVEC